VLAGDGDGDGGELVGAGVGELVSVGDGDELVVPDDGLVGVGDETDGRHRHQGRPWWRQTTRTLEEEVCAVRAIGTVKPASRAATTAARARTAFMGPRP
jgi:hypothetical protein